jgi:hypothetical protein
VSPVRHQAPLLILALLASLGWTSSAHALDLYVGGLAGYGFTTEDSSLEPYALGLGANGGITLSEDFALYLGARLLWFSGETSQLELMRNGASASVELSRSYLTYGVDVGYDFAAGPLVLRPELGIGGATLYVNDATPDGLTMTETSDGSLYLAPALELLFAPSLLYLGAEIRYMAMTASGQVSGVVILGHIGLTI